MRQGADFIETCSADLEGSSLGQNCSENLEDSCLDDDDDGGDGGGDGGDGVSGGRCEPWERSCRSPNQGIRP